jgi:transposase
MTSTTFVLDRIFYVLRTGCQWRELPSEPLAPMTVYHYFRKWSRWGIFEKAFYHLAKSVSCDTGLILDTTYVKNVFGTELLGRNPTDRGRKATKVSLMTNLEGTPLSLTFHTGNKNDNTTMRHSVETAVRKSELKLERCPPLYADKGYDSSTCRAICSRHNLQSRIARRGHTYESRNLRYAIEQTFGLLDRFRRIILRYDRRITTFKSFWFLATSVIVARRSKSSVL